MANTYPPDDFFSDNPAVLRSLVTKARHDAREAAERRYEAEARHTEARGMLCQERDSWKAKAEQAESRLANALGEAEAITKRYAAYVSPEVHQAALDALPKEPT